MRTLMLHDKRLSVSNMIPADQERVALKFPEADGRHDRLLNHFLRKGLQVTSCESRKQGNDSTQQVWPAYNTDRPV